VTIVQCVLLAGGLGTRMRPMTEVVPKAMLEVAGRPFADHQLALLARQGYRRIVFCIGYRGALIRDFVGDGSAWGLQVSYSDEGSELRGTAGALRLASRRGLLESSFCVVYGDSYLTVDPHGMWSTFIDQQASVLMAVWRNDGHFGPSNVAYAPNRPLTYRKSAPTLDMHHIDYGLTMFRRDVIDECVPADELVDLAGLVEELSARGEVEGIEVHERFYEIGSPEGRADLAQYLAR
jgi:NDP-sugar pyrophosphorylase family protein